MIGATWVGHPRHGAVTFVLPSGRTRTIGNPSTGPHSTIKLNNFKLLNKGLQRGTVGFAEAYIKGDIECDDLTALFRFFLKNRSHLTKANPGLFRRAAQDVAFHLSRRNTKEQAKQNIAEHYDLGNDFYSLWLDPTMTYSSAYFESGDQSLEDAQRAKYRRVAEMAGMTEGASVLEIGCGWGGFAEETAANIGASVRGITLSNAQLKFARDRIEKKGLGNRATFAFEDYRDTKGEYDHIASIEMIEAVGEEHWPQYFGALHDRLKPGGTASIQAITIKEADFEHYRRNVDFIQRYIFPGGMLLTKEAMKEQGDRAGLVLEQVDCFGQSYANTLRLWYDRFLEVWNAIAKLGFDEEFKRKWVYYLNYCEAGFAEGSIDVGIYQYRRPA